MPVTQKTILNFHPYAYLKFAVVAGAIAILTSCGGCGSDTTSDTTIPETPLVVNWEDEFEECDTAERTDSDLPRRIRFSDDGLRLVTGLGEQDDFYYFSTDDDTDIKKMYLYFSQDDWWEEMLDNVETETEMPATMIYDKGSAEPRTLESPVGVRFKGETSLWFNVPNTRTGYEGEKKSFNISLDYEDLSQDIDGFKNLNLNCAWGDNTFMREVIYEHVNQRYIPAVSVNYVELYINDVYWGIYINSQQIDNNFYREWFTSTCGTNWRAEPPNKLKELGQWNTGLATLNYLGDTTDDYIPYYTIRRYSVADPWYDLINVCAALENTQTGEADYEDIVGQYLDIDRALWFLAMEIIFGDEDSYVNKGGSDYYVYWDQTTGLLTPIEYDGNSTLFSEGIGRGDSDTRGPVSRENFLAWDPYADRLDNPDFPLINKLLNVPSVRQRYLAHMRTVLTESFNPANMNDMIDAYAAKIRPYIDIDQKTFVRDFSEAVTELKNNVAIRCDNLWSNSELNITGLTLSDVKWIVGTEDHATPLSTDGIDEVIINATVTDPANAGGINSVWAYVGEGIVSVFTKRQMHDDGAHGDGAEGDGIYGVVLDEEASGVRTRFYIEAIAADTSGTRTYYPAGAAHDVFTYKVDEEDSDAG
jgi:hypothetical protein